MYNYPNHIPEHTDRSLWKYEDIFNTSNKFKLIKCYMHTVDTILGMHSHSFYELNVVISGTGRHYIDDGSCLATEGMVFMLPPNTRHGYYSDGVMKIYHILLSGAFCERFSDELTSLSGYSLFFEVEPLLRGRYTQDFFLKLEKEKLDELIKTLENLKLTDSSEENNVQIARNAATLKILCEFCSLMAKRHNGLNLNQYNNVFETEIIKNMQFLVDNCCEKQDFNKIAAELNMSYATYLRYFKQICGKTPSQYITQCRINHAKKLLKFTDRTIVEIAVECGFFDSSHFVKVFKQFTGLNPKQFRN